jgi:hypothetical protein
LASLLTWLTRRIPAGASLVVLTARPPHAVHPTLRRLQASGFGVEVLLLDPDPEALTAARGAGIAAREMTLSPDWKTANVVELSA